jgi:tyrosinase
MAAVNLTLALRRQDLTATEKSDYIDATRCLIDSPPKAGVSSAKTRWDEFQYAHAYQTPYIHGVVRPFPLTPFSVSVPGINQS